MSAEPRLSVSDPAPCICGLPSTWDGPDPDRQDPRRCALCDRPCSECGCRVFRSISELVTGEFVDRN